jgi:hypothetical protein
MKLIIAAVPTVGFLAAGVTVVTSARAHQLAGTQMSNGKGGTMAPADGYLLAAALFALGLLYASWMWKLIRTMKKEPPVGSDN